jgi:sugar diacid utilization regulator
MTVVRIEPHRRAIAAHASVVRSLSTMTTVEDVLRGVATALCDLVGAERCSVYLKDDDTGIFRGCVGRAPTDIDAGVRRLIAGVEADRFTREIVETCQPVLISDARVDPRPVRSTVRAWDIRSMLGVPLICDNDVIGLAFADDEGCIHRFSDADYEAAAAFGQLAGGAVGQALATVGARASLRAVTRQNQLLRRAAALDERLTRLAVDGGGLEEILSVVAERTGKPVAVLDERIRPIAVAPAGETGTYLRSELERWNPEALARELSGVVDEPSVVGPYPERGVHHRFMLGAIRAREQSLGHIVMGEVGAGLSALDRHALRRSAAMVALELSAQRRVVAAERDTHEALLSDLLRGDRDAAWLTRRGAELGIDLLARHVICLIGGPVPEAPPEVTGIARSVGDRLGVTSVPAAPLADSVALLLPVHGTGRESVDEIRDAVADLLATGRGRHASEAIAAISDPASGPEDVKYAHIEAGQVLRCLRTLADRSVRVLSARDLGAGRLFLSSVDRSEADRFARRTLGVLLEPDVGGELLDTLQAFFVCGRGLRLTATSLGVHENTIRYRFAKLRELSRLDIYGDVEDQMTALLALRVLQLEGLRPWDSAFKRRSSSREPSAVTHETADTAMPPSPAVRTS